MRLSEALYERKKIESKILKSMNYRNALFNKKFPEVDKEKLDLKLKRYREYLKDLSKEINKINLEIDSLIAEFIELAHKVNEKNIELETDKKLMNMKFVRIELGSLNKLTEEKYFSSLDVEKFKETGIEKRIEEIEEIKRKLDNNIGQMNFTNELML